MKSLILTFRTKLHRAAIIAILAVTICLYSCSVMLPVSANSTAIGGTKKGSATAIGVLGLWPQSDASIETAAKNGGITKVSTVNVKVSTYFWLVTVYETKVTGE